MRGPQISAHQYSVEAVPSDNPSIRTGIRRNASHPNGCIDTIPGLNLQSCWDLFQMGRQANPKGNAFGKRKVNLNNTLGEYEWITYLEAENIALRLGTAIIDLKLVPEKEFPDELYVGARKLKNLGIFTKNRVEWFLFEQAANAFGLTLVPLYDTLGDDAVRYIMKITEMETVVVSLESAIFLLETVKDESQLKTIILLDNITPTLNELSRKYGIAIRLFESLKLWENKKQPQPPTSETVATLAFTSGTTGNPKGVLLSHKNFVATICGVTRGPLAINQGLEINNNDVHLSYLPLAHVFERAVCNILICKGAAIGVYSGDTLKLLDDVRALRPTIFISVPRLFLRINDKLFTGVSEKSAIAQFLFNSGMKSKLKNLRSDASVTHAFWDGLVFKKSKQLMGGRIRYMLVGGAPLEASIQDHIKVLFCAPLCEGYGLTETLGTTCVTSPNDPVSGHVGGPVPCVEFRIESVPDMNYLVTSDPPRGELHFRGPALSAGYFKQPLETEETFDEEGWFKTGDIVVLLPNGGLKIIDRKKNIFKLAQGEYVSPEKVEGVYQQSSFVSQIFVFGISSKYFLVGIVVPETDYAIKWGTKNGIKNPRVEDLCKRNDFKLAVMDDLNEIAKKSELNGFEKLKDISLTPTQFTTENNLLTPTFKLKRHFAKQHFEKEINAMYSL